MMPIAFIRNQSQNSKRPTMVLNRFDSLKMQRLTQEFNNRKKESSPTPLLQTAQKLQSRQKPQKLPTLRQAKDYTLTEEEKQQYGDRIPFGYEKVSLLGRGGFALVWQAKKGNEMVAIKQITKSQGNNNEAKFHNVQCENVIKILGYEQTYRDTWIIQELCGQTLGKALYTMKGEFYKGERVYAITETPYFQEMMDKPVLFIALLHGILNGVAMINEKNVTHCDLKPDNILIKDNVPKIIDFGSAFLNEESEQFGMITPEYMAPEVLEIMHNWSKYSGQYGSQVEALIKRYGKIKVDVWSYGAIILDILQGIPNWLSYKGKVMRSGKPVLKYGIFAVKGRNLEKIIQKQSQLNILQIVKQNSSFLSSSKQSQIYDLLSKCLSFDPQHRPTATSLLCHDFFNL